MIKLKNLLEIKIKAQGSKRRLYYLLREEGIDPVGKFGVIDVAEGGYYFIDLRSFIEILEGYDVWRLSSDRGAYVGGVWMDGMAVECEDKVGFGDGFAILEILLIVPEHNIPVRRLKRLE